MLADLALKQAGNDLIGAPAGRGLVIISCDSKQCADEFYLFFVARDSSGYDRRTLSLFGLYDDLDVAVTIASIGYGVAETAWEPLEELSPANSLLLWEAVKKYELDEK